MENLWTPWRFHYLTTGDREAGCVFCRIFSQGPSGDQDNLVLSRDPLTFTLLNLFPYTSGHLLIVLNRHVASLTDASNEEMCEMMQMARTSESLISKTYSPHGFNIGFNLGACAGAGVAGHLHLHVVPRWSGDSNFVAVIGQTRNIADELGSTYGKLFPLFQNR